MENKFDYLRIDGRKDLPEPWCDYPVVSDFETVPVYQGDGEYLYVLIGQQDGYWVAGVSYKTKSLSRCFYPGRKWGQFASRDNALLWGLGYMLGSNEIHGAASKAILYKINDTRQLKLF